MLKVSSLFTTDFASNMNKRKPQKQKTYSQTSNISDDRDVPNRDISAVQRPSPSHSANAQVVMRQEDPVFNKSCSNTLCYIRACCSLLPVHSCPQRKHLHPSIVLVTLDSTIANWCGTRPQVRDMAPSRETAGVSNGLDKVCVEPANNVLIDFRANLAI